MKNKFIPLLLSISLMIGFPCSSYATEIVEPEKPDINNEQQVKEYDTQDSTQEQINIVNTQEKTNLPNKQEQTKSENTEEQTKSENTQEQKVQTETKTITTPTENEDENEPKEEITFPFKVTYHFVYKLGNGTTAEKTSSKTANNANYTGTIQLPSFSPTKYIENGREYKYAGTFEGLSKVIVKGSELTTHDVYLNADYNIVPIATVTFICKDINGEDVVSSVSNTLSSPADSWTVNQATADNKIENYKTYTKDSIKYTFSHWEFTNWEEKDFPIEFKNVTKDIEITVTAQYDKTYLYDITGHYIYLTSLGNKENEASTIGGSGDSYSHEFRTPPDIPNQYTFLYWKNYENGDIKRPGDILTIDKTNLKESINFTYYAVYDFQPQIKLIYHYKEGIKDTGAKSEPINIYDNQPKNLKWFYNKEGGEPIPEGEIIPLPNIIPEVRFLQDTTPIQKDVYAHYYTVTWEDWDGSILEEDLDIPYGNIPVYNGEEPNRQPTAQYTYTFIGWEPTIEEVTKDVTYTAQYAANINKYKITWQDWNGLILEEDLEVPYGELPSYDGIIPIRMATTKYTYEFIGWEPEIELVTGDKVYTAKYKETLIPIPPVPPVDPIDPEEPEQEKESTEKEKETKPKKTETEEILQIEPNNQINNRTFTPVFQTQQRTVPVISTDQVLITNNEVPKEETPKEALVPEHEVPLGTISGEWALLNLLITICSILLTIISFVLFFYNRKKEKELDNGEVQIEKKSLIKRFLAVLISLILILIFIFTEDMTLPMAWTDRYTLLMLLIFFVHVCGVMIRKTREKVEKEYTEDK